MFAKRTDWNFESNPLMAAVSELQREGIAFLDLTESNPTRCEIAYPAQKILSALQSPLGLTYDPCAQGLLKARQAVAAYYADRGCRVSPERIFLTASTSEAYAFVFRLLLEPGQEILIPRPSYPLFQFLAELNDAKTVSYDLVYHAGSWHIDFESLAAGVSAHVRVLIVVNPNNPTGSFVKTEEWPRLAAFCRAHQLALVCDEVFADYRFVEEAAIQNGLLEDPEVLTFQLSGISKTLGLPQMKLGWMVIDGPAAWKKEAIQRLEVIADTYLSVNTPVQEALGAWLSGREEIQSSIKKNLEANRRSLIDVCAGSFLEPLVIEGGWYGILKLPPALNISEDDLVMALLLEEKVLVHPGYFFDFTEEGFLVVSLLTRPVDFAQGIARIKQHLHRVLGRADG